MKDWRGNEYEAGEPLWKHPEIVVETNPDGSPAAWTWDFDRVVPTMCDWPGCDRQAVRHRCNAEGDVGRTHHHGGVHRLDDGVGTWFCRGHGIMVLEINERLLAKRTR